MAGETTLIVTTRSGVRPLGVRGEPLHNSAPQLRRVVRRRLGDGAADLLADPQLHEDGKAIDWYAGWPGAVQPLSRPRSGAPRSGPGRGRAHAWPTSAAWATRWPRRARARTPAWSASPCSLPPAQPADSFVFLVGDRPVIVCWGYEKEAAAALLPAALPQSPLPGPAAHRAVLEAPIRGRRAGAPPPPGTTIPWARTLLAALPLLLLLLGGAWLLRGCCRPIPALALATREGPDAPPAPEPAPDPKPALKASFSTEESRGRAEDRAGADRSRAQEAHRRLQAAGSPEAAAQVALAPPPPPQPPKPAPAPAPQPRPARPNDDRLRLPSAPTNDYSFMQGCWRTDPFRHETIQPQPGISSYCFDANGNGQLEWRRGRTACRTRAQSRFDGGGVLRLRDADTTCNDGSHWYADQLVCRRGADDVANAAARRAARSVPSRGPSTCTS